MSVTLREGGRWLGAEEGEVVVVDARHSRIRQRLTLAIVAVLGVVLALFDAPSTALSAHGAKITLKVAVAFPRTRKLTIRTRRYNKKLARLTDNRVQVRVYWGGAAGDERDVLRKMRTGQIDGSPFGLEMMSNIVREALVLASPALFVNYKQVDAVRHALTPDFDKEAYRNGFKVMGWGDVGRLRLFSKRRFSGPEEFRTLRPWLYPESQMLKEFYKMLGATGVPLGIAEVYSGMQTGMIDTFWGTAVIASALQWHRTAKYISARGMGFISGAFAIRRAAWDALPEAARQSMIELANEERRENQIDIRRDDELSFRKLLKRGYVGIQATPEDADAWWTNGHKLRERMIGRVYTRELVDRVEDIALRYADAEQRRRFARLR